MIRLLSVRSKPVAVRMFAERADPAILCTFLTSQAQVQTPEMQVQTPNIDKHRQQITTIDNIHKIHASKIHGRGVFRILKRHRQLRHRCKGLGDPEIDKSRQISQKISKQSTNITKYILQKHGGVFFLLREPKHGRQL